MPAVSPEGSDGRPVAHHLARRRRGRYSTFVDQQMHEIDVLIRARDSLLYVVSWEERRVLAALQEVVMGQEKQFYTWSETTGLRSVTKQITPGSATRWRATHWRCSIPCAPMASPRSMC